MIRKLKICMVGATGVGKTSLVGRFVRSIFSDSYRTTVGVCIEKARVCRGGQEVDLIIWDLSGEDEFQSVQIPYLRGAAGYLLVVDGTRPETLSTAQVLRNAAAQLLGDVPTVLVVNKTDRPLTIDIEGDTVCEELGDSSRTSQRRTNKWCGRVVKTSAKTGDGVREAFDLLLEDILNRRLSSEIAP